MKYILAYGLVIVLVQFCLTLGTLLVGFPIALCFAWSPGRLRAVIAGTLSGVGGVVAAVAFGFFVFRLILGPNAFGLIPLLASTLPLTIPILNDLAKARQLSSIESGMSPDVQALASPTTASAKYAVVGYILGLILAGLWFFFVHEKAA